MSLAIVYSRASIGIRAPMVTVEAHISNGLPGLSIVGLPETAVKESKDRVRSAIINSNFEFPARRITINLAPADLPKDGGRFDLPIALGILAASGQIPADKLNEYEFAGELALSGALRPIYGVLPFALATREAKRQLIIPADNAKEASLSNNIQLYPAQHLLEVCAHISEKQRLTTFAAPLTKIMYKSAMDLAEVYGQQQAKRALEIAAAGQHSLLMVGPPGTGKTMLASRLCSILPEMSETEALELAAIHSICGKPLDAESWRIRPFRAPHHTASSVALVGGGSPPQPGEISLAHHGVLFLDELPEFNRQVLEALREPLESGYITISRASYQSQFPAKFQLIAAMNPCPCGYLFSGGTKPCTCSPEQIRRYQAKISGPLLDRIDMQVQVLALPKGALLTENPDNNENSSCVLARVIHARYQQLQRTDKLNSALTNSEIKLYCQLDQNGQDLLNQATAHFGLSARIYHRMLKVARTIADLANSQTIKVEHISEALSFRGGLNK